MEDVISQFQKMKDLFPEEYEQFSLTRVAGSLARPHVSAALGIKWNPLSEPDTCVRVMSPWKKILSPDGELLFLCSLASSRGACGGQGE